MLAWLHELHLDTTEFPEMVFIEMGANRDGPLDRSLVGVDDTITAIFSAARQALTLLASRMSAHDFFIGCQNAGLVAGMVNSPEEAFEDEHFKARGLHVPVHHEDFDITVTYPGAPFNLPKSPWAISRRAPHLGEHNDEVLGSE